MSASPALIQPSPWPKSPYKGLSYYGPADQSLYAGRDADIRRCGALLMLPETRTLILHGKTGCGKSSFLRAGLIPTIESEGFGFEFLKHGPADNPRVVFIRCTNAPLKQLADRVFELANTEQEVVSPVGRRTVDLRGVLKGITTETEFRDRVGEDGFLTRTLAEISTLVPKTLILVLDQAEEVLTLNPGESQAGDRSDFFAFLQEFNSQSLDVKLVIALRTEYYGRFFNAMNIDSRVRSDAKEYLLEDLNEDMLLEAIERPTLKTEVPPWGTPFDVYRFQFAEGLPQRIARDLLTARNTGGVLPVMQIVCRSLYDEIASRETDRVVTARQYEALGGVEGRIDEHIRRSLLDAFHLQNMPAKRTDHEEDNWRLVICKLAAVQEDGTVTTNVLPGEMLKDEARELQTQLSPGKVLDYLASPEVLLLRKLSLVDVGTGKLVESFSLGHDVIGLALNRWRTTHEEQLRHNRQIHRLKYYGAGAACGVCLAFGLYYFNQRSQKEAVVRNDASRIARQAKAQGPTDYQLSLLLAVTAHRMLSKAGLEPSAEALRDLLTPALVAAPDYAVKLPANVTPRQGRNVRLSGQRLIVASDDLLIGPSDAVQVVLNSRDATIGPMPETDTLKGPWGPSIYRYWSHDGTQPLFRTVDQIQATIAGQVKTFSLAEFSALIVPRLPPLKGKGSEKVHAFGRETIFAYQFSHESYELLPLTRHESTTLSFSAGHLIKATHLFLGNRSSAILQTGTSDTDGSIQLIDFAKDEALTIYGPDAKVSFQNERIRSDAKENGGTLIEPTSLSFAPDDGTVAFVTRTSSGARFINLVIPDWPARRHQVRSSPWPDADAPTGLAVGRSSRGLLLAIETEGGAFRLNTYRDSDKIDPTFLYGMKGMVSLKFTDAARRLIAFSPKGMLLVWDTDLDQKRQRIQAMSMSEKIQAACALAARPLTQPELLQYVGSDEGGSPCGKR